MQNESLKKRQTANGSRCARWRHMDMNRDTTGDWNIAPPARDINELPCSLFENLFTDELYELICLETVR